MTHTLPTGLNNAQRGKSLEDLLQWRHNIYRANNLATVWYNGTKAAIKSKRNRATGEVETRVVPQKSRPDFEGVLTCLQGRHVAFDSKLISGTTYRHSTSTRHQLVDLWDVHAAGGIAFLLVSIQMDRFFLLWPQAYWQRGEFHSVRLNDVRVSGLGVEVPLAGGYGLPSWLDVVEEVARS